MTIPRDLPEQMADVYRRIGEVERRNRNRKRSGTIDQIDHAKGLYRVKLSEQNGKPFLTDWIRTRQIGAGTVKVDVLLNKGEQVDVVSESGDLTDAIIDLSTYSDQNKRVNQSTPMLVTIGDTNISVSESGMTLLAGSGHLA
ncbi:baseplate assembly protein [Mesorhizobium sp. B2-5-9]|uniref:phage baseplate assembly protein V n=1 Tax=Mesorhizobium sp. B2-5-9 TaxID=2589921 RepID=UPI001125C9F9|nr:phage baseplate assembly protein V [Mesorhizobium sp. B2-5-9]TPK15171.1 baseplate assembly protein [Mesorhizobium sp. B2-5-9]